MDFNFNKFTDVGKRFEDKISVTRNRAIGLPTQFYKQNNVGDYKYGVLFYDEMKNAIGIKFTNDDNEEGKISINHSGKYGGHLLAQSFFKANRINTKRFSGRYEYTKRELRSLGIEEDGYMYIIELVDNKQEEKEDENDD